VVEYLTIFPKKHYMLTIVFEKVILKFSMEALCARTCLDKVILIVQKKGQLVGSCLERKWNFE